MAKNKDGGPPPKSQLWHKVGADYVNVGHVLTADLQTALVLPMLPERAWDGRVFMDDAGRPTTFGDVIVDPRGVAFELDTDLSFRRIEFPQHAEQKALFAEWRADYAAAAARDQKQWAGDLLGRLPGNDNDKPERDTGRER